MQRYLSENPSLLVWDNFETVLQHADAKVKRGLRDFLKKLPGRSRALVTCRRTRVGVMPRTKEKTVDLDVLDASDAEELTWLHAELEDVADKLHAEREKIPTFIEAMGNHPLGISLAIPQLALRDWTLTELIRAQQESVNMLALDPALYDDPEVPERLKKVAASFELTYAVLSDSARAVLPKFATAFPGGMPPGGAAVQTILGIDETAWDQVINELNTHNLLRRRLMVVEHLGAFTYVWYLHPLLRTYAAAKVGNDDEWRQGVAKKYASAALNEWSQFRLQDGPQALAIFDVHEANLLHWLAYCEAGGHWVQGVALIIGLADYYDIRGRWGDWERILLRGIALARRHYLDGATDKIRREASCYIAVFAHDLGKLYQHRGRLDHAERCYGQSLKLNRLLGLKEGEADGLQGLGDIAFIRQNYPLAKDYYEKARTILRTMGSEETTASIIGQLASVAFEQGEDARARQDTRAAQGHYAEAKQLYEQALDIYRRVDDRAGQAQIAIHLGNVVKITGDVSGAEDYYRESLNLSKGMGDRHGIAAAYAQLGNLGNLYDDLGCNQDALSYLIRAATIFHQLGAAINHEAVLHNIANLIARVGFERFVELCRAVAAESADDPEEVNALVEKLSAVWNNRRTQIEG